MGEVKKTLRRGDKMRVEYEPKGDESNSTMEDAIEGLRGGEGCKGEGWFQSAASDIVVVKDMARLWRKGPRSRVDISIGDNRPELRPEHRFIFEDREGRGSEGKSLSFDIFDSLTVSSSTTKPDDEVSKNSCGRDVELRLGWSKFASSIVASSSEASSATRLEDGESSDC